MARRLASLKARTVAGGLQLHRNHRAAPVRYCAAQLPAAPVLDDLLLPCILTSASAGSQC